MGANVLNPVKPVYPLEARQQGIEGIVRFEAVLSRDGVLVNMKVIASPDARLTQAAMDALKQWTYKPTMLNGEPVETTTTIDVNFALSN